METLISDLKKVMNSKIKDKDKYIKKLINGFLIERDYEIKKYLDMSIFYKEEYRGTPWYKFKRRRWLYRMWNSALDLMYKNLE